MATTDRSRAGRALLALIPLLAACSHAPESHSAETDSSAPSEERDVDERKVGRHTVIEWEAQLSHEDPRMRLAAVRELEVAGESARPLGPALLARVVDDGETFEIRTAAMRALPKTCGETALPALAPLFSSGGKFAQNAASAMLEIGPASTETFIAALDSPDAEVRRLAASSLFRLFELGLDFDHMSTASVALAKALGDESSAVRRAAYRGLVFLGARAEAAVPELVAELEGDADDETREAALVVLGKIGQPATAALPAIERELTADKPAIRLQAATAMAALGRVADALPVMSSLLSDEDPVWRREAAIELGKLGRAAVAAGPALEAALEEEEDAEAKKAMDEALTLVRS